MSTTPSPIPERTAPPPPPGRFKSLVRYLFLPHAKPGEIVIVCHSPLFYWWPVWLVGFIVTILTLIDGHRMALVPRGTEPSEGTTKVLIQKPGEKNPTYQDREVLIVPEGKHLPEQVKSDGSKEVIKPTVRMAVSKNYGILFMMILLVVIFITNVPLRGLWSLFVIIFIVLLSVIFAQAGVWEALVNRTRLLAIHMNLGGYLFMSLAIFIIWLVNFFFFDRQFYMIFTPGQVRVHLEIGAGETVYDTSGMVFQKQRSDLFRHWILGFGSGDLIVRPAGGQQHIDLPNVLSVGRRVKEIEKKLAEKEVVAA
jgi:hypothetical protein